MAIEKMTCVLGRQDIPVIQEQPEFTVDLLDSNILLFGQPMSGKTNLIKLLITISHKLYREDTEQIFILDFGGALAEYETLPLVAAYFDNANEEYVKRVFKLMEDQLKDNIKKLKGKNYRAAGENQPIHTTLYIDNVNAFLDEPRYTAYHEKLAKLCRDSLSKGITIVMTASNTKGLSTYMGSFKQKIALEMPADSYSEIFNHKVIPVGNNAGRGFANVTVIPDDITGTFPLQLAYELQLNITDNISDEFFQSNLNYYFGSRTVKKYKRFPDVLTYDEYRSFAEKYDDNYGIDTSNVSVGLDYTECKPVSIDFDYTKTVAIYGKKGFGKTNLLRVILNSLTQDSKYKFVFFDDGRAQLKEFDNKLPEERKHYIEGFEEIPMLNKGAVQVYKLSPMQQFIKLIHENYMELTQLRRLSTLVMAEIFGAGVTTPSKVGEYDSRNTVFVLQSKFLYVNSIASKDFMEVILPLLAARAEEMNWIFLFTDVKVISDSETRDNFHSTLGAAFLLDNIAEFVGERGKKSIFGNMDIKTLKEEYARCEEGDGYFYSIEKDDLKKLKFIKTEEEK
ncbi:MAG: cell division protein FtsK [Acutalibacteraceae bacterium]|nr:cell division protein FtsK [Clostridia bacterium]MEE3450041.1 cell division protein FtsK [Acutalibacteraceae bacterium]